MHPRWTPEEVQLLRAAQVLAEGSPHGVKSDLVLREVLGQGGRWDSHWDEALCNAGEEHPRVAALYATLRSLVRRGFLLGRGDWRTPAGPRYTECAMTPAGRAVLQQLQQAAQQ